MRRQERYLHLPSLAATLGSLQEFCHTQTRPLVDPPLNVTLFTRSDSYRSSNADMGDTTVKFTGSLASIRTIVEDATKALAGTIRRTCRPVVDFAGLNALILRK